MFDKTTAVDLWAQLEELYMTKSHDNKIRLKEELYTFRMTAGTPIQKHLNDFNLIIIDLESLDVKLRIRMTLYCWLCFYPRHISILRRSCSNDIVILILYRLRMLSQTYFLKKSLIMIFILILLRDWSVSYTHLTLPTNREV